MLTRCWDPRQQLGSLPLRMQACMGTAKPTWPLRSLASLRMCSLLCGTRSCQQLGFGHTRRHSSTQEQVAAAPAGWRLLAGLALQAVGQAQATFLLSHLPVLQLPLRQPLVGHCWACCRRGCDCSGTSWWRLERGMAMSPTQLRPKALQARQSAWTGGRSW